MADARARADAVPQAPVRKWITCLRIEEQRDSVACPRVSRCPCMRRAAKPWTLAVPIESGEIEVRARVTLTAAIK